MPVSRTISGEVVFPADAPHGIAESVLVELRDVSAQDAPSTVLASTRIEAMPIGPGARLRFELQAPESAPSRSLSLRAEVNLRASGRRSSAADYLSTTSIPVAPAGDATAQIHIKKM